MQLAESSFCPNSPLEGLSNYKEYFVVDENGGIYRRVFLDVPDVSLREEIICIHHMCFTAKLIMEYDFGVRIITRDCPWDFELELSNGDKYNVEITAIAETARLFEMFKDEERMTLWSRQMQIPLFELERLNRSFPNQEVVRRIEALKKTGVKQSDYVENYFYSETKKIFTSRIPSSSKSLIELIDEALSKKEKKNHPGKENTVIVLDNRTLSFEVEDLENAIIELSDRLEHSPFKEIWFYTGYASESNGSKGEFSFSPMKISAAKRDALNVKIEGLHTDGRGTTYT